MAVAVEDAFESVASTVAHHGGDRDVGHQLEEVIVVAIVRSAVDTFGKEVPLFGGVDGIGV